VALANNNNQRAWRLHSDNKNQTAVKNEKLIEKKEREKRPSPSLVAFEAYNIIVI